ncbi:MAG: hypothetical protein M4579_001939 [Chaenotheca gracillima]|nr:MAG: hypothetical protein M4579_001939 [Chaenotheca gracillima]
MASRGNLITLAIAAAIGVTNGTQKDSESLTTTPASPVGDDRTIQTKSRPEDLGDVLTKTPRREVNPPALKEGDEDEDGIDESTR